MFVETPTVEVIDSRDDVKLTYFVVEDCKVPVMKAKVNNACYVLKLINDKCHISLDLSDCKTK